jgi:hypothetical protein
VREASPSPRGSLTVPEGKPYRTGGELLPYFAGNF